MPKVRFTKDYKFAENGYEYTSFEAGDEKDVSESCADSAIQAGAASLVQSGNAKAPEATKNLGDAPENKATKTKSKTRKAKKS